MPFRHIAGHRHLIELMARAATRGTLPPSLIFAGPDGVGKRMAAVALAQLMNCLAPVEVSPREQDADASAPELAANVDMVGAREFPVSGHVRHG